MPQEIIEGFRLSPQQKHLWPLRQSDHGPSYCTRCVVRIEGELDVEILQQAIRHVIGQHEILRTTFRLLPGMTIPVQVISDRADFSFDRHDATQLSVADQKVKIDTLFVAAAQRVADCERLPLLRADLIAQSSSQHALIISAPAVCADALSLENFIRQTVAAYDAYWRGEAPARTEAMQYADFAEWQNELLQAKEAGTGKSYWKQDDLIDTESQRLPFEKRFSSPQAFQPASVPVEIRNETHVRIKTVASSYDLPFSSCLLACWQTLISRLIGTRDVIVGAAFNGRKFAELEDAVGLFSTFLPIRGDLPAELAFHKLCTQITEQQREALRWQEYFARDDDASSSDPSKPRFFPFSFEFRQQSERSVAAGLVFSIYKQDALTDRFKVKLVCEASADSLVADLHYDSSLYSASDVRRLADQLKTLIEDASHRPEAELDELEAVSDAERHLQLVEFNNTRSSYPNGQCIHELFESQAEQRPDQIAVVCEAERLTYRELNARANQLAHHLLKRGVKPDLPVGLCLDRSVDLIVGLLGIMKAGGAYVPLDPGLPKSRLGMMLEDAKAQVLVTRAELAEGLRDQLGQVVCLDADREVVANEDLDNPSRRSSDQNLVYVIFTSGSTGRPKGVAVEHRHLVNYLNAIWEKLDLPIGSSFATVSTIAADLGNTVLFPALCKGGILHLIAEERATDPDALAEYFSRNQIDCLKIVPTHLTALLSASSPAGVLPRRRLVLGGEACSWSLIERIRTLGAECAVFNHYGPTEATVGAIAHCVQVDEDGRAAGTVPLGRPLANEEVYVLDKRLRPVPIAAAGELYIGGSGVARGYVNRADATAETFVPHPFASGERLYKTGDLVRYFGDGRIEFLGRVDDQVNIHGYRIEPGEIEIALRNHARVAASVVVAREDKPGDRRLVAYVVTRDREKANASDLRAFLNGKLPEYMTPSAFVFLDSLPLTSNGKIDRRALPPPDLSRPDGDKVFAAPRNQVEETLARIWGSVLGVERVGIHDNFFELGGDSILSIQIIARANQAGLKLSPRQLFQHQTVAELATVAGTSVAVEAEQGVVTGAVPLTPVQARFFKQDQPEPHYYNQARLLRVDEALDVSVIERALEHLLVHHDALRLRFAKSENGWQQVIAPPDGARPDRASKVESFDLSHLPFAEQSAVLQQHAASLQASLDLQSGPLMRVALFKRGVRRPSNLLIVIHHLAVDGVSWGVLLEDLQTLYTQLRRGKKIELAAKTTSFKSWSEQLTAHANSDALRAEAPYWLALLKESVTRLPVDYETKANTAASARTVTVSLNPRETLALLLEVPAAYRTQINEVLLTALARTLGLWTGASSVLLDLEGHGREEIFAGADLSRTVGWFTTIFPVALDLKESQTPVDAVRLVKEQLRAIPNRGIGYGLLRYANGDPQIAAALSGQPQAEVRFNYLGQTDRALPQASMFEPDPESSGPLQSPKRERGYLLNIIGAVTSGELRLEWTYSENIHRRETVERLARSYIEELQTLIAQARSRVDAASFSPIDFPRAKLSPEELKKVLAKLTGSQGESLK